MGWVAGPSLVSGTANAGGWAGLGILGILAAATMTLEEMVAAIAEVRRRTDRPFGVNLRSDAIDVVARIDHLISAGVKVASFAQAPRTEMVKRLRDGGVVVVPTVGARRHAEKVAEMGVDAVLCQGAEGGGHTGTIPTSLLLPQVIDAVDVPVIAAGGFHDGRGLAAALAWGADGIAMGTRFLPDQRLEGARRREADLPRNAPDRHRGVAGHRRCSPTGDSNSDGRGPRALPVDTRAPRRAQRAQVPPAHRDLTARSPTRRSVDEKEPRTSAGASW